MRAGDEASRRICATASKRRPIMARQNGDAIKAFGSAPKKVEACLERRSSPTPPWNR